MKDTEILIKHKVPVRIVHFTHDFYASVDYYRVIVVGTSKTLHTFKCYRSAKEWCDNHGLPVY